MTTTRLQANIVDSPNVLTHVMTFLAPEDENCARLTSRVFQAAVFDAREANIKAIKGNGFPFSHLERIPKDVVGSLLTAETLPDSVSFFSLQS